MSSPDRSDLDFAARVHTLVPGRRLLSCWRRPRRWKPPGAASSTWRSASRMCPPSRTSPRPGSTPSRRATPATRLRPACLPCAGPSPKTPARRRGIPIEPAQVVVGPGAKPALFFPTLALVRPGDEVIYPDPGFPTYAAMIEVAGGTPVPVPLREEEDFSFDLEAFDRLVSERTRMIVLNSPSNPTGGVMPLAALEHIAEVARERDLWVLSDEIYARLVYDQPAPSIAALPGMAERTDHLRRLLQDLCHDRLAPGLWHHARGRWPSGSSCC